MKVVLIGGGGHASDVLSVFEAGYETLDSHPVIGFLDDGTPDPRRFDGRGVEHLGKISDRGDATHCVLAVGWPQTRMKLNERVADLLPVSVSHPASTVHPNVKIGRGTVIMAGAVVSAGVNIGDHAMIHHNAVVGHDCQIGDFVSVMPSASVSGDTTLERGCMIGAGAVVREGLTIGAGAIVGMGSVVIEDVPAGARVVGNPARDCSR